MKKLRPAWVACTVLALLVCSSALAEDVIELNSGETVRGKLVDENRTEITVQTGDTKLVLPKSMVKIMKIEVAEVHLSDGRKLTGQVKEDTDSSITLRMKLGEVTIDKMDTELIEHKVVEQKPLVWEKKERSSRAGRSGRSSRRRRGKTGLEDIVFPKATEKLSREEYFRLQQRGINLLQKKRYAQAIDAYQKILRSSPRDSNALYNTACAYALMGRKDRAAQYLRMAVAAGFTNFTHIERDSDLNSIRRNRDYKDLMKHKDAIQRNEASMKLEQLKADYGEGYTYQVDENLKLIFATNQSLEVLERLTDHLSRFATAQWKMMWKHKPDYYLTVICPDKEKARELLGPGAGGVYHNGPKVLVCGNIGTVLDHEFTHALNFADMDARQMMGVPIYIIEGIATLFEATGLAGDKIIPRLLTWRFGRVKKAVDEGRHHSWEKFINWQQKNYDSYCYAQGRYMFVYLYEKGKVRKWYDIYCKTWRKDRTGKLAWEKVFGKSFSQIEQDWIAWIKTLKSPKRKQVRKGGPFFGVDADECDKGLALYKVVWNSPADKAGLEDGDIMTRWDGKRIKTHDDFIDALNSHQPGDEVEITVLRGRRKKKFKVTLGHQRRR